MKKAEFTVPKMACSNCLDTIRRVLSKMDGVSLVSGDVASKTVSVEFDEAVCGAPAISEKLSKIGFPVA